jgi:PAS domain S-box-containing protein
MRSAGILEREGYRAEHIGDADDLRRILTSRSTDEEIWRFFFDNIPVTAIVSDRDFVIQQWNKGATELFGYTRDEAVGCVLSSLLASEKNEFSWEQLKATLLDTLCLDEKSRNTNYDRTKDGRDILCQWLDLPFRRQEQEFIFSVAVDITREQELLSSLRETLQQKDFLMQEIYHRLKNNLNMIISLINLKADEMNARRTTAQSPGLPTAGARSSTEQRLPEEKGALQDISGKISTFSVLYDMLYQVGGTAERVQLGEYLSEPFATVFSTMAGDGIRLSLDFQPVEVAPQTAITLGLISNEIATNAIKYGFPRGEEGHVFRCALAEIPPADSSDSSDSPTGSICEYTLANTGNPFPEAVDLKTHSSLGMPDQQPFGAARRGGDVEKDPFRLLYDPVPAARF